MLHFGVLSHGQRLGYWTNEATALLQGSLQPIYRIPKSSKRNHEVSMMLVAEDTQCHAPFCYRLIVTTKVGLSRLRPFALVACSVTSPCVQVSGVCNDPAD
ncbi:unnamed protein product [Gadus morhua 'NCC']